MEFDGWLFGIAMAIFSGVFQALKRPVRGHALPREYYLFVILLLGPLIGVGLGFLRYGSDDMWNVHAMMGLLAGLSGAGLYSGVSSAVKSELGVETILPTTRSAVPTATLDAMSDSQSAAHNPQAPTDPQAETLPPLAGGYRR